jgi:hypothetical protein
MFGWNTKYLDIMGAGFVYADDHPYIGLKGKISDTVSWEALYLSIYENDADGQGSNFNAGPLNSENMDWRCFTLKLDIDTDLGDGNKMHFTPFAAFSDNGAAEADVFYAGLVGYGKLGIISPRFEVAFATGEMNDATGINPTEDSSDIFSFAASLAFDFNISKAFVPFIGGYYIQGDDDAFDGDVDAFNGITNIGRYTKTFGNENSFLFRSPFSTGVPIYGNFASMLGNGTSMGTGLTKGNGYGEFHNWGSQYNPGLIQIGGGIKGTLNDGYSYKVMAYYMMFEEEGALEDVFGKDIDDEMGYAFDISFTKKFNKHFSLGNVVSIYVPGDAYDDMWGVDETAVVNTVEFKWDF